MGLKIAEHVKTYQHMSKHNIIIIGLGPHARACQYNFLEEIAQAGQPVNVKLLVELQDRKEDIENYLANKNLLPDSDLFEVDELNNGKRKKA